MVRAKVRQTRPSGLLGSLLGSLLSLVMKKRERTREKIATECLHLIANEKIKKKSCCVRQKSYSSDSPMEWLMSWIKPVGYLFLLSLLVNYLPFIILIVDSFLLPVCHLEVWRGYQTLRRQAFPDQPAIPLIDVHLKAMKGCTSFEELTGGLSRPLVIRQALSSLLGSHLFYSNHWMEQLGNRTIDCIHAKSRLLHGCKIEDLLTSQNSDQRKEAWWLYSRGNQKLLADHPHLLSRLRANTSLSVWSESFYRPSTTSLSPSPQPTFFHELSIDIQPTLSSLHASSNMALYRQISGHSHWILWSPQELSYLDLHLSRDGSSLASIDEDNLSAPMSWIGQTRRYEVILDPGDVLFLPAMWAQMMRTSLANSAEGSPTASLVVISVEKAFDFPHVWRASPFCALHLLVKRAWLSASSLAWHSVVPGNGIHSHHPSHLAQVLPDRLLQSKKEVGEDYEEEGKKETESAAIWWER